MKALSPDFLQRFGGIARLYGTDALQHFASARVAVVGCGGVGSWTVEALARSGIGTLILVDLDDICLTNTNRQIQALSSTVGQSKTDILKARIQEISPECEVISMASFYRLNNAEMLWELLPDAVVDATDDLQAKSHLVATAKSKNAFCAVSGGAGGRLDSVRLQTADLARTHGDKLLQKLRKQLRSDYNFPRDTKKKFGVPAVFSDEPVRYPWADGSVCESKEAGAPNLIGCDAGFGTSTHLAGSFGFALAGLVLQHLASTTNPPSI